MEQLDDARFPKLRAYLKWPADRRVRKNNPLERTNRLFRFLEKVRYERRRRALVRFVVLKFDEVWRERFASGCPDPIRRSRSAPACDERSRRAA
jgi:hypothetical protein